LPDLAAPYLTPRQRIALADKEKYTDALAWATREINPTVALLEPGDGNYTVYDFALDRLTTTDEAPPAETWQLVVDNAEVGELDAIGYQAEVTYGHHDVAERAYRLGADNGNVYAMAFLGDLLKDNGELGEAETWYRRAADTGNDYAMTRLGDLLKDNGELGEAETWYRRAADTGDVGAN